MMCLDKNIGGKKMEKLQPIGLFHTPDNMDELMDWLNATKDQTVVTGAMMMYNLLVTHFNQEEEE